MIQSASIPSGAFNHAYKTPYSRAVGTTGAGASFASASQNQNHGQIGRTSSAHMQQTGQSFQFTSVPSPRFPPPQSQSQQAVRPSASPPAGISPHEGYKYPMAVPPTSVGQQPQPEPPKAAVGGSRVAQSPTIPQSPGTQGREQQRINLLLEINNELLQEIDRLQADGQGGVFSQQQLQQLRSEGLPEKHPSELYVHTMRRVQANLAWLMPTASQSSNVPPGPALMTPPPHMPALVPLYDRLKGLFPGWQGLEGRMAANSSSPRPNGPMAPTAGTPPSLIYAPASPQLSAERRLLVGTERRFG
ncbi:uncharacterized protein RCC_00565 [Ramularia collo-cygni]|uniref:Uncharacterized protein n=1 Tax=Ramularia collo-cygni TaxID=112498 RepID=A0A2D3UQR0_9PEZI|nr:uncharacterized protein RCC_00565 [Ramularia collo-cygni]CZT14590.1 uncharacterized protein RCC_00565 [Ramularia collo-cygni]